MLQRIQTVYLLICFVISGVLPLFVSLFPNVTKKEELFTHAILFSILFGLSALLAVVSIFSYKKRKNQFVINRLNMILNFIIIGLLVYHSLSLSGEAKVSEKGIGMLLPIFSIVFLALANRAIKRDEDLVKSVDRIR
jgi:cytochrome bd-type quinol oxidase subunit 2